MAHWPPTALPEGLNATLDVDGGNVRILDAQGVPWVTLHSGGNGDPDEWRESIEARVLYILGIEGVDV